MADKKSSRPVVNPVARALSAYGADKRRWPPGLRRRLDAMLAAGGSPARALTAQLRQEAELDAALLSLQISESAADAERRHAQLLADFDAQNKAKRAPEIAVWRLGAMLAAGFALGIWSGLWITEYMPLLPAGGPSSPSYVTALLETAVADGITRFFP